MLTRSDNVVALDPQQRARDLVHNWKTQPAYVLAARSEALRAMQANGIRLTREVYEAWVQISAIVTVQRGRI